jgi:hypothetical protein
VKTSKIPSNHSENAHKWKLNRDFAPKTGHVWTSNHGTYMAGPIFMWDEDSAWICTVSWGLFCSNAPMQIEKNNQLRVAGWVGHEFA